MCQSRHELYELYEVHELLPQCPVQEFFIINLQGIHNLLSNPQDGASSLYIAAQKGHMELVRALLEGGADVNQAQLVCAYFS